MIPATCPHGKDPRMCAYCDKKDTCDCRCDKNTDVIWGEITGELKDQTDLQAALDKHTADILTVDTLAHSNEQRLDSVEGTAKTTKALADVHTTRLNNVEGVANEANQRSQNNMKRLDRVEGVANGAQALANNHTELINNVEATANEAKALAGKQRLTLSSIVYLNDLSESQTGVYLLDIVPSSKAAVSYLLVYQADEQGKLYQTLTNGTERKTRTKEKGGEWTGWTTIYYANASDVTKLQMDMQDIKTRIEALEAKVNTNQSADNA